MSYIIDTPIRIYNNLIDNDNKKKLDLFLNSLEGFEICSDNTKCDWIFYEACDLKDKNNPPENVLIFVDEGSEFCLDDLIERGYVHFFYKTEKAINWKQKMMYLREIAILNYKNQILDKVYDSAQNSIVITDDKGQILFSNNYFLGATGYEKNEIEGNFPRQIKSGFHDEEFYERLWNSITKGMTWHGFFVNRKKSGELFYEEATISPIKTPYGDIFRFLKIGKIVEREKMISHELSNEISDAKEFIHYVLPNDYKDDSVEFSMKFKAYNYLGGDYVCFTKNNSGNYILGLIDVMGHGATASLMGLRIISQFETMIKYESLETTIAILNNEVVKINQESIDSIRYITGVFIEYDPTMGKWSYINAGHPEIVIRKKSGAYEVISSNNIILGVGRNCVFRKSIFDIEDFDYIFFYSDGLTELYTKEGIDSLETLISVLDASEKENTPFLTSVFKKITDNGLMLDDVTWGKLVLK